MTLGRRRLLVFGIPAVLLALGTPLVLRSVRPENPDLLFRQARAQLQAGQVERARQTVNRLARARTPDPFDRLLRAQVADAGGRLGEAVDELAAIPDAHPLAPVARLLTGQVETRRHRLRAAEAAFLATIKLEPDSPNPRRELVFIYNLQHRQTDLDAQLHALSERGPLEFNYLVHWGKTRNVVWNPERDCKKLAECVEADPDDRLSRLALAEGYERLNFLNQAIETLEPLPQTDPDATALRADVALNRGDFTTAERLLSTGPAEHAGLSRIRGMLALKRGDAPAAVTHLKAAHAADPTDRPVLYALGSALRMTGDTAAAEPYLAAARFHDALTPLITRASTAGAEKDPALPARMGAACEAAGRLLEARAWYKLAIARDPLDADSQKAVFRTGQAIEARERALAARVPRSAGRAR